MPLSLPSRLPAPILVLAAVFGLFATLAGAGWFVAGKGAVVGGFPNNLAEAVAACAGGIAVFAWAIVRIRRQSATRH